MFSVLYVDDETALLEVGKIFLEGSGALRLDTAESAKEAIEKLNAGSYDGIISDYLMPRMDGLTFLQYIRASFGDLPFILFTGKGREEVAIEALNSGADYYLQKGGEPTAQYIELEHKIILAIQRRQTALNLQESQKQLAEINARLEEELTEKNTIEVALRASERRLQGIVHGSPIPQFVIDRNHCVISWNEALEAYSGVRAGEVLGTTDSWRAFYQTRRPVLADIIVDGTPDRIPELYGNRYSPSKYIEGAYNATDFFPHMGPAGTWLFFTASPIRDAEGTVIGSVETLQDITDIRKKEDALRAEQRKIRALLDQTFQFIGLMTPDGALIDANRTALEFSGIAVADVLGKPFWETPWWTHSPTLQEQLRDAVRRVAGGEFVRFEATHRARDGSLHFIDFSLKPVKDEKGSVIYLIPEGRDITERKKTEDALRLKLDAILSPDGELVDEELANIINGPELQSMMNLFYSLTGMGIGIIDLRGNVLVGTGWQEICTQFFRVGLETRKNCIESDLTLTAGLKEGEIREYKCKNNMWDIATPIIIGNKHIGNIFFGQFLYDDEEPDYALFAAMAKRHGFEEEKFRAALDKVPRFSRERVPTLMGFYAKLAHQISALSLSNIRLAKTLAQKK